jgi:glycosyltransferase involved in cell wall biosynthesis
VSASVTQRGYRWLLVATESTGAARAAASREQIEPALILTRREIVMAPLQVRRRAAERKINAIAVHSRDWKGQANPQIYDLVFASIPARRRLVLDDARGAPIGVGRASSAVRTTLAPLDLLGAVLDASRETFRFYRARNYARESNPMKPSGKSGSAALVIWAGGGSEVGGSVSHAAGIMTGLKQNGFRVGLVATRPLPRQLRLADDVEFLDPLPRRARLTGDLSSLAMNALVRQASARLARRLRPAFVYQRHRVFLYEGAAVARRLGIPLILEWNASEVWARANWSSPLALESILEPLAVRMERHMLAEASVIAAVSEHAAEMAMQHGVNGHAISIVPNAVDFDHVRSVVAGIEPARNGANPLIGWIGSFGPWHGAEVLIRALPLLPDTVRAVMIGDGVEREDCARIAAELHVQDQIEWTGILEHDAALRRLAACDVLVSPHVPIPGEPFFGSPTKIFEYMATGRPVVSSDLGQLGQVLHDRLTARLVQPGDVRQLAQVVLEVLESDDRGRALGERAIESARREHTWAQRAAQIVEELNSHTSGPIRDVRFVSTPS